MHYYYYSLLLMVIIITFVRFLLFIPHLIYTRDSPLCMLCVLSLASIVNYPKGLAALRTQHIGNEDGIKGQQMSYT